MTTNPKARIRLVQKMKEDAAQPGMQPSSEVIGLLGKLLRWLPQLKVSKRANPRLTIVETLPLGGRQQVILVRCDEESFLVGTGVNGVGTIVRLGTKGTV
jgi:flagellar biogenesis protein FliO